MWWFQPRAVARAIPLRASATAGPPTPVRPAGPTGPARSGNRGRQRRATPLRQPCLRLLALAILGLSNPGPAAILQAQTGTTLVSNTGQSSQLDISNVISQVFTTGSQDGGYAFTTVDVYLGTQSWEGGCEAKGSVEVSIYSNTQEVVDGGLMGDVPGSSVHALTAPSALTSNGFNTFTAPANARLNSDTDYHVRVAVTSDDPEDPFGNTDWCVGLTSSTSEDDGGVAGWSIGDKVVYKTQPEDHTWFPLNGALLIKIARVDRAPDPDPDPDPDPTRAPTVTASCEPCSVGYGGEVRLKARVRDLDGDSLSYQWYAPEGWLKDATKETAWWKAPHETGRVWLRVRVSDGANRVGDRVAVDVDPASVPALPLGGAVLLGLLLAGARLRRGRTAR